MSNDACVQCGYCCSKRPCSIGSWDQLRGCCVFLEDPDEQLARRCKIYKSICLQEKDEKFPMMGCGCSSSMFNGVRKARIRKLKEQLL